jgi:hypothetical protein
MPTASKKVLAENLRQLQQDGVLVRADFSNAPAWGIFRRGGVRLHMDLYVSITGLRWRFKPTGRGSDAADGRTCIGLILT